MLHIQKTVLAQFNNHKAKEYVVNVSTDIRSS